MGKMILVREVWWQENRMYMEMANSPGGLEHRLHKLMVNVLVDDTERKVCWNFENLKL